MNASVVHIAAPYRVVNLSAHEAIRDLIATVNRNHQVLTDCIAVVLVVGFRIASSGATRPPLTLRMQLLSGLWLGLAAWTVGALLQAWVALWEVLLLGLALSALVTMLPGRIGVQARPIADFVGIAALGPLSVIPVRLPNLIFAAAAFTAAGLALDRLARRMSVPMHRKLVALAAILVALLGITVTQVSDFGLRQFAQQPLFLLRLALVAPNPGVRAHLESDTAAWTLSTPVDSPRGTAILLHGNDPLASSQPAALAMQGALMRAGYNVLSVDHPGYGATPAPNPNADWGAWDPTLGPKQALSYLRSANNGRAPATIVVAHSMGVEVALKWLSDGADVQAEYLFGGSIDRPTEPESDWIRVFHQQRQIPCCIPLNTMRTVRDQFYGGSDRFARALPPGHPVVHFVRFGFEYPDVTLERELLYRDIPAAKTVCDFSGVTHYFNTLSLRVKPLLVPGFVLIDTLAVRRTAEIFSGEQAGRACSG